LRVLAAHCQVPLSQDARQAKLEHLAPPRQPLARRALCATTLIAAPRAVRIVCLAALVLAAFALTNLVYHVVRKPSELLFFVGGALDKEPIETWRQYEPLFHTYSTSTITPELLAALAQVESTGNPVARTYWRW
jgi:hypothetical protein